MPPQQQQQQHDQQQQSVGQQQTILSQSEQNAQQQQTQLQREPNGSQNFQFAITPTVPFFSTTHSHVVSPSATELAAFFTPTNNTFSLTSMAAPLYPQTGIMLFPPVAADAAQPLDINEGVVRTQSAPADGGTVEELADPRGLAAAQTVVQGRALDAGATGAAAGADGNAAVAARAKGPAATYEDGECGPQAFSIGARLSGLKVARDEIQTEICGAPGPGTWRVRQFIQAARCWDVIVHCQRPERKSQSFGVGKAAAVRCKPKVLLRFTKNGEHVEADMNTGWAGDAEFDEYVDVGAEGDAWIGRLSVLEGVRARSGTGAAAPGADGRERSPPSTGSWQMAELDRRVIEPTRALVTELPPLIPASPAVSQPAGRTETLPAGRPRGPAVVTTATGRILRAKGARSVRAEAAHQDHIDRLVGHMTVGRSVNADPSARDNTERATARRFVPAPPPLPAPPPAPPPSPADEERSAALLDCICYVYGLVAATSIWVPHSITGFTKAQGGFHIKRIMDALPDYDPTRRTRPGTPSFASCVGRWHCTLMQMSCKIEYMLVRLYADEEGVEQWASSFGPRLRRARELLPPGRYAEFLAWDPDALVREVERAVVFMQSQRRAPHNRRDRRAFLTSACGLIRNGQIAAARSVVMGEPRLGHMQLDQKVCDELQRLNEAPTSRDMTVQDWDYYGDKLANSVRSVPEQSRVTKGELSGAARTFRSTSAPGPDGISGGLLKSWQKHFPEELGDLLMKMFLLLRDTDDSLVVMFITDATVGALPKANGKIRPIVIATTLLRCILARLVKRSRKAIARLLESKGQFCQTGVFDCVALLQRGVAWCCKNDAPWCVPAVDETNAFNATAQVALAESALFLSAVAPELAACALRTQCGVPADADSLEGAQEMVVRGKYEDDVNPAGRLKRFTILRRARGGGQGSPDMPPLFGGVMAIIEMETKKRSADMSIASSREVIRERLWHSMRGVHPGLSTEPDADWDDALVSILDLPFPLSHVGPSQGPVDGELSAAYADDAHSAGWVPKALYKTFIRIAVATEKASLTANDAKCKVLVPSHLVQLVSRLVAPLRRMPAHPPLAPVGWEVVTSLRILGVIMADPKAIDESGMAPIADKLDERVCQPLRRLITEMQEGLGKSTAFFLVRRYVLPNLMFQMQAWGLHAPASLWRRVDEALDDFVRAFFPDDMSDRLAAMSRLRRELALPQEMGGLGLPIAAVQAPIRAAEQWAYDDAVATDAQRESSGYKLKPRSGCLPSVKMCAIGIRAFAVTELDELADDATGDADGGKSWSASLHSRGLRGALWNVDAPPWDERVSLTDAELDRVLRLNFGGVGEKLRLEIDGRKGNEFAWRGKMVEELVRDTILQSLPSGTVHLLRQPVIEQDPPDHFERSIAMRICPFASRRADIAVEYADRTRLVLDVAAINVVSHTAIRNSVIKTLEAKELDKDRHYRGYYRDFEPLIVTLAGGITERGWRTLKRIACKAARLSRPRFHWEPFDWAVRMLRLIAAGVAKVVGWMTTRVKEEVPSGCTVHVVANAEGRFLELRYPQDSARPGGLVAPPFRIPAAPADEAMDVYAAENPAWARPPRLGDWFTGGAHPELGGPNSLRPSGEVRGPRGCVCDVCVQVRAALAAPVSVCGSDDAPVSGCVRDVVICDRAVVDVSENVVVCGDDVIVV